MGFLRDFIYGTQEEQDMANIKLSGVPAATDSWMDDYPAHKAQLQHAQMLAQANMQQAYGNQIATTSTLTGAITMAGGGRPLPSL